ncbi:MAG: DUF1440 domain-containing protein [Actinobacteria bacterium]|nr:DUF1440 domain-containing protein [Actinomycetota bacterium]
MAIRDVAGAIAKGLVAGAVGTAAMTVSSTLEMRLRGREASSAPADAAAKVLGLEFDSDAQKARFGTIVHWGYGTGWGAVRGLLSAQGLGEFPATTGHLCLLWVSELVMLPALEVAPPVTDWEPEEVAIDFFHHVVYAVATGVTYGLLNRMLGRDR